MNSYNRNIADRLLRNQIQMINHIEQPEMFNNELDGLNALHNSIMHGGARPLKYVMTGNNIGSSEPRTLSVGKDPFENVPMHLIESGSNIRKRRGRPSKNEGGNIFDTIGAHSSTIAKFAPLLLMAAGLEKKKRGRPKKADGGKLNFLGTLKSIGQTVAPVAQQVAVPVAQQMLSSYLTKGASNGAGLKKRGRPKKADGGNFLSGLSKFGKTIAPIASQVGTKIVLPVATQALTNYAMSGAGVRKVKRTRKSGGSFLSSLKSIGKTISPIASQVGTNVIMPVATNMAQQALTNYMSGSSSTGSGLKKTSNRGQLIKKIMSERGLSLPQASKFIKEHGLK